MVDRLAAHGGLEIRIAARVRHHRRTPCRPDGDVLTLCGDQVIVARHAVAGRREQRRVSSDRRWNRGSR